MTPRLIVVTDRRLAAGAGHDLAEVVAAAVEAGAPAILLRDKDLPAADRRLAAQRMRSVTAGAGAALYVAGDGALAREVGADGVHLAATDPLDPWPGLRVGRSCHTVAELVAAARAGVDYATFSPVFATASKPGYGPALGLEGLAAGCRAVAGTGADTGPGAGKRLAVHALGGIGPAEAGACRAAGAGGVAVMGAVMGADDPGGVVRALLGALAATGTARA